MTEQRKVRCCMPELAFILFLGGVQSAGSIVSSFRVQAHTTGYVHT